MYVTLLWHIWLILLPVPKNSLGTGHSLVHHSDGRHMRSFLATLAASKEAHKPALKVRTSIICVYSYPKLADLFYKCGFSSFVMLTLSTDLLFLVDSELLKQDFTVKRKNIYKISKKISHDVARDIFLFEKIISMLLWRWANSVIFQYYQRLSDTCRNLVEKSPNKPSHVLKCRIT